MEKDKDFYLLLKTWVLIQLQLLKSDQAANAKGMNIAEKLLDSDKKTKTDAIKTASKGTIQKATEISGDLFGNKIADKITSIS